MELFKSAISALFAPKRPRLTAADVSVRRATPLAGFKQFVLGVGLLIVSIGSFLPVTAVHAQATLNTGINDVGTTIVLPANDPRQLAARIINVALGLVGIILVAIILYAGFLYMTAGGDAEKTQKALRYIRNSIIGLIIILSAWALTTYIIDKLLEATNDGGSSSSGGGGGGGGGGFGGGGSANFGVISITPSGSVNTRKVIVKVAFNKPVDPASAQVAGAITVTRASDNQVATGDIAVNNQVVTWTSTVPCPAPNTDRRCLDENTDYTVTVAPGIQDTSGDKLTCGGFSPACQGAFHTGTAVDITPPDVFITYPVDGQGVSADALVDVNASVLDDTGVAMATFQDGTANIGVDAPTSNTPTKFNAHIQWDTAALPAGSSHALTATGYDVDSGVKTSSPVTVIVRNATCFNGVQDGPETGVDCGGNPASPDYCGACSGSSCSNNSQCASSVCTNGVCVEQPIITNMSPQDGAIGSYVTITGANFGAAGQVFFMGSNGSPVAALTPQACVAANVTTWSPTQVVVEVPPGAQNGPVKLTNTASTLSDVTNAPPGPAIPDFLVNNTLRPAVCAVVPTSGAPGASFQLLGKGFGNTSSPILFADRTLTSTSWSDGAATALVPNVANGTYPVGVRVGALTSNAVDFRVVPTTSGGPPQIASISPSSGPIGTYVTLTGSNFGNSTGQVFFHDVATGKEALADVNFPPQCSTSFWSNTSVIVKVPPQYTSGGNGGIQPGNYAVRLVTSQVNTPPSNEVDFSVNTDPATPGICAVTPSAGPVGTAVQIYGERFTGGPGSVTFYQTKNGSATPWTNAQIASTIPAGAITGPVTVTPSSGGLTSNGYLVQVANCNDTAGICRGGEECCGDGTCRASGTCVAASDHAMFAWRTSTGVIPRAPRVVEECSTGKIPSPSPWSLRDGGNSACVNSVVTIRFTTQLEPTSVSRVSNNVQLFKCTPSGTDPCATKTAVPLSAASPQLRPADATQDYLTLSPQAPFDPSTMYDVVLTTGVKGLGAAGANMVENASRCGTGNAYCFTFTTRADVTPCAIGSVEVSPDPYTASEQGPLPVNHDAIPLSKDDACIVLECRAYNWTWSASDGRASVTNNVDTTLSPPVGACEQTATAQLETGDDPVKIQAATQGVTGSADLYIKFLPPRVDRFGPDCDEACVNAAAWAVFNVPLNPATVTPQNVTIQRCVSESCLELDPPLVISASNIQLVPIPGSSDTRLRQINILPVSGSPAAPLLLPGRFYKVTLHGGTQNGIRSWTDVPLSGLNDPDGFAWTFRVKPGDSGLCKVDRIDVAPTEKYETVIGARQGFVATPFSAPDMCSAQGQQLIALSGYSWGTSQPQVADFLQGGTVDTGATLPIGCSGRCTFAGASGKFGQTARCGDGRVQTTNAAYCVSGKTPSGQVCDLLPAGGIGGEECDDANANNDDACNNSCLWNPVASVAQGGTCGNGVKNAGEDCDHGTVCSGASANIPTPNGVPCDTAAHTASCTAAGGTCIPAQVRGCSATCRNLGATAGGSTCGNGDIADGEDCDDGNSASGDGCSADCLNEGSSRNTVALCGNGILEPGESCERAGPSGPWPIPSCDPVRCVNVGTRPCDLPNQASCCGNAAVDKGEDCDDGNSNAGDGCSSICLAEGSSPSYAAPSFCGNGVLESGEQCEAPGPAFAGDTTSPAPGGDGLVDPFQIAEIVGKGTPDTNGRMSSNLSAKIMSDNKTGTAVYGLQCGYTDENSCPPDPITGAPTGLTTAGCCDARPKLGTVFPPNRAGDTLVGRPWAGDPYPDGVCRNVLISGGFTVDMDLTTLQPNFVVAKRVTASDCPSGTTDVTLLFDASTSGWRGTLARAWHSVLTFFRIPVAEAQKWCAGTVTGTLTTQKVDSSGSQFYFTLNDALEAHTEYRVRFLGDNSVAGNPSASLADNADPTKRTGVKSWDGVVAPADTADEGSLTWHFTTGDRICTINQVDVTDETTDHPYFYTQTNESHPFTSTARSVQNGRVTPLSPTTQYAWEWQNWVFSKPTVIGINPPDYPNNTPTTLAVTTKDIFAKNVSGSGFLSARVKVTKDTVSVPTTEGQVVQGTADLTVNLCENPWPSLTTAPFRDEAGSPDLYGTIFANGPDFYNFSMTYCRDAGAPGGNEDLPSLIINAVPTNAADASQGILRQYLFTFNEAALQKDGIGIRIASNPLHLSPLAWYQSKGFTGTPQPILVDGYQAIRDGRTVYVSAASTNGPDSQGKSSDLYSNIYVISYNAGADPVTVQVYNALVASLTFNINVQYDVANACQDSSGSLVSGSDNLPVTCSADWECDKYGTDLRCASFKGKIQRDLVRLSDFQSLAKQLDQVKSSTGKYPALGTGSYLPGFTTSRWPSWTAAFQSALTDKQAPAQDPVNRFVTCGRCGQSNTACVSDADCAGGDGCTARDGFDPATCWNAQSSQFRCPADGQGSRFYDYHALASGVGYELDAQFEVPPPSPADPTVSWWKPAPATQIRECTNPGVQGFFCQKDADCGGGAGTCQPVGGMFQYTNVCQNETRAATGSCGDGVLNGDEVCELTGPTATRQASCTTTDKKSGSKQQKCFDCKSYADDTSVPGCFALTQCGNGRIDSGETCDNGVQNGTYGNCNLSCTGIAGYCGDGMVSPGETCDLGSKNGQAGTSSNSCNLTCNGPGPYCGDGNVDSGESCDNNTKTSSSGCSSGYACVSSNPAYQGAGCSSDADCGDGGTCNKSQKVPYVKTATCSASCTWNSYSGCRPAVYCGNGTVDTGEQCDDGNANDTDSCTNKCQLNVCGDSSLFKGVEECDAGANNGKVCTSSEYGSTCSSCSTICKFQLTQGGYCGDGLKNQGSSEQCDATDLGNGPGNPATVTCKSLGYDYALNNSTGVTCTPSCQFGGCGYCGSQTGDGSFAGVLMDTLFQQPVPGARVALFYRGLQVQTTTSDDTGYFSFSKIDRTSGCDQYKVVIDSYVDNPNTANFDESKRGGYQPVNIGPFTADKGQDKTGEFNRAVTDNGLGVPLTVNNAKIVQINMLPRLGDKEYVVQLWWDPVPDSNNVSDANGYQDAINQYRADPQGYDNSHQADYHDLMIRMPSTYTPGTYGSCTVSPKPVPYTDDRGDLCFDTDSKGNYAPGCSSVDYGADTTSNNTRFGFIDAGMSSCTNKIRATASGTCINDKGQQTELGCNGDWDCVNPGMHDLGLKATCNTSRPEPARTGPLQVLDGRQGAYLFCFHPEKTDPNERASSDCGKFVVPPQSAFIDGGSGQYDVIVSQFQMFGPGAYGPQRINEWLRDHDAEIRVYDKDGLYKTWNYPQLDPNSQPYPPEWEGGVLCPNDPAKGSSKDMSKAGVGNGVEGAFSYPTDSGWPMIQNKALKYTYAGGINQYWTPISIDTTNQAIKEWDGNGNAAPGAALAAFDYFADTYWSWNVWVSGAGNGECWYETCSSGPSDETKDGSWPPSGKLLCNDNYMENANARYSGDPNDPACDAASKSACQAAFGTGCTKGCCTKTPNKNVRCVQFCATNGSSSECTGNVAGSSGNGTVPAFCGGGRGGCGVGGGNGGR